MDNTECGTGIDFNMLVAIIKSEHTKEFIAVDQLCDSHIMINEFNVNSFPSGEVLDSEPEELHNIRNKLHDLIDKQCIVLRDRPLVELPEFNYPSMVAFFDVWRNDVDGERDEANKQFKL